MKYFNYKIVIKKMANAFISIYENGEERSLDTFSSVEIDVMLEALLKLIDNKYVVDLYTGYIYDIDYDFMMLFGVENEKYPLNTKIGNFEVSFDIQDDDDDNDSQDSYS